jgi:hypothetical protein
MDATRAFVKKILEHATRFEWSLQGFGMLRLHLDGDYRLNIWDKRFRVKDVSLIHSHPWDFESLILCGELRNQRFAYAAAAPAFGYATIKPGPGGGILDKKGLTHLRVFPMEVYHAGQTYCQKYDEIHVSDPVDGTVTLNKRVRVGKDVADVFWPAGQEWVSAEPRKAEDHEIHIITQLALQLLKDICDVPPPGWRCTRNKGHSDPCAAIATENA